MMNQLGSEEFSQDEFNAVNAVAEKLQQELEKKVGTSNAAREFLSSPFGKEIRDVLATNIAHWQERCTQLKGDELDEAQFEHRVWQQTTNVLAVILKGGDDALLELEGMRAQNNG